MAGLETPSGTLKPPVGDKEVLAEPIQDLGGLKEKMQAILEETLSKNPDFFYLFRGKTDFFGKLREPVDIFKEKHKTQLAENRMALTDELDNLNTQLSEARKNKEAYSARKQEIMKRIKAIQTPLGNLPVGLNESVLLFPIVLAVGFILCVYLLTESVRLRKTYYELWKEEYPELTSYHDKQILLVAPIWIDPQDPTQNKTVRWLLLLLPLVLFIWVAAVILAAAGVSDVFFKGLEIGEEIWFVFYALSLAGLVYGTRRVIKELRI